jgi:hypothetical protein
MTASITSYMVQPFVAVEGEDLNWPDAIECFNPGAAVTVAGALARTRDYDGAIAYSITHDPQTNKPAMKVLARFGTVPDDFGDL